jgi:hypothetical protein
VNTVVCTDHQLKISDFGLSLRHDKSDHSGARMLSILWLEELVNDATIVPSADI